VARDATIAEIHACVEKITAPKAFADVLLEYYSSQPDAF
jgi:hypothetical protein